MQEFPVAGTQIGRLEGGRMKQCRRTRTVQEKCEIRYIWQVASITANIVR